ncbi:MAG: hypothetical protein JSV03_11300, partial [Planctomycetota bacterium]
VMFCDEARLWDIAAGALIAGEAGAVVVSLSDGRPCFPIDLSKYRDDMMPIMAGRPEIVKQLMAEYRQTE